MEIHVKLTVGRSLEAVYLLIIQHFSCRSTTVGTFHARSLQGFAYGDVVHQFEKRTKPETMLYQIR